LMGARSAEALARRAARRGRTEEEQRKYERTLEKEAERKKSRPAPSEAEPAAKRPRTEQAESSDQGSAAAKSVVGLNVWQLPATNLIQKGGKLKKDAKAGWMCTGPGQDGGVCSFINFPHRSECRSCGLARAGGPPAKASKPPISGAAAQGPGPAEPMAAAEKRAAGKVMRKEKVSDPSRAWEGSVVTPERLAENKRLREKLAADPDSLSAEDRARAEALVARDARKREKREALKKSKAASLERQAQVRAGFRDKRREGKHAA